MDKHSHARVPETTPSMTPRASSDLTRRDPARHPAGAVHDRIWPPPAGLRLARVPPTRTCPTTRAAAHALDPVGELSHCYRLTPPRRALSPRGRRATRPRPGAGVSPAPLQVLENPPRHRRVGDEGDDARGAAAMGAHFDVDRVTPASTARPTAVSARAAPATRRSARTSSAPPPAHSPTPRRAAATLPAAGSRRRRRNEFWSRRAPARDPPRGR